MKCVIKAEVISPSDSKDNKFKVKQLNIPSNATKDQIIAIVSSALIGEHGTLSNNQTTRYITKEIVDYLSNMLDKNPVLFDKDYTLDIRVSFDGVRHANNRAAHINIVSYGSFIKYRRLSNVMKYLSADNEDETAQQIKSQLFTLYNLYNDLLSNYTNRRLSNKDEDIDITKTSEYEEFIKAYDTTIDYVINSLGNINKNNINSIVVAIGKYKALEFLVNFTKDITRRSEYSVIHSSFDVYENDNKFSIGESDVNIDSNEIYNSIYEALSDHIINKTSEETFQDAVDAIEKYKNDITDAFKQWIENNVFSVFGKHISHEELFDILINNKKGNNLLKSVFGTVNALDNPELFSVIAMFLGIKHRNKYAKAKVQSLTKINNISEEAFNYIETEIFSKAYSVSNIFNKSEYDDSKAYYLRWQIATGKVNRNTFYNAGKPTANYEGNKFNIVALNYLLYRYNNKGEAISRRDEFEAVGAENIYDELESLVKKLSKEYEINLTPTTQDYMIIPEEIDIDEVVHAIRYIALLKQLTTYSKIQLKNYAKNISGSDDDLSVLLTDIRSPFTALVNIYDEDRYNNPNNKELLKEVFDVLKIITELNLLIGGRIDGIIYSRPTSKSKYIFRAFKPDTDLAELFSSRPRMLSDVLELRAKKFLKSFELLSEKYFDDKGNISKANLHKAVEQSLEVADVEYDKNIVDDITNAFIYLSSSNETSSRKFHIKINGETINIKYISNPLKMVIKILELHTIRNVENLKELLLNSVDKAYTEVANMEIKSEIDAIRWLSDSMKNEYNEDALKEQEQILEDWEMSVLNEASPDLLHAIKQKYGITADIRNKKEFIRELARKRAKEVEHISPVHYFIDKMLGNVSKKFAVMHALEEQIKDYKQKYGYSYGDIVDKHDKTEDEKLYIEAVNMLIRYRSIYTMYGFVRMFSTLYRYRALALNMISGIKNFVQGYMDNRLYYTTSGVKKSGLSITDVMMHQIKQSLGKADKNTVAAKLADIVTRLNIVKDYTESMLERIDKHNKNFTMWFQQAGEYINQSMIVYNELSKINVFKIKLNGSYYFIAENMITHDENGNYSFTVNGLDVKIEKHDDNKWHLVYDNTDEVLDNFGVDKIGSFKGLGEKQYTLFDVLADIDKFSNESEKIRNIEDYYDDSEYMTRVIMQIESIIAYYHGNYNELDPIRSTGDKGIWAKFMLTLKRWMPMRLKLFYGPRAITPKGTVEQGAFNVDMATASINTMFDILAFASIPNLFASLELNRIADIGLNLLRMPFIPFVYALTSKTNKETRWQMQMSYYYLKAFLTETASAVFRPFMGGDRTYYGYFILKDAVNKYFSDKDDATKQAILNAYATNARVHANNTILSLVLLLLNYLRTMSMDCKDADCEDTKQDMLYKTTTLMIYFIQSSRYELNGFESAEDMLSQITSNPFGTVVDTYRNIDWDQFFRDMLTGDLIEAASKLNESLVMRAGFVSSIEMFRYLAGGGIFGANHPVMWMSDDFDTEFSEGSLEGFFGKKYPVILELADKYNDDYIKDLFTVMALYFNDNDILRRKFIYRLLRMRFDTAFDIKYIDDDVKDYLVEQLSELGINVLHSDNEKNIAHFIRKYMAKVFYEHTTDDELLTKLNTLFIKEYYRIGFNDNLKSDFVYDKLMKKVKLIRDKQAREEIEDLIRGVNVVNNKFFVNDKIQYNEDNIYKKIIPTRKRSKRGLTFSLKTKRDVDRLINLLKITEEQPFK